MDADGGGFLPRPFRLGMMISCAHWSYQRGRAEQRQARTRRRALSLPLFPSLSLRAVARTHRNSKPEPASQRPGLPFFFQRIQTADVCERKTGAEG